MNKRKIAIALILCLLTLITISSQAQTRTAYNAKEGVVTIKGKIGNINPPMQVWIYMGDEKWDTVPVKNGKFTYSKETLLPAFGAVMVRYRPFKADDSESGSFFQHKSMVSLYFDAGVMEIKSENDTLNQYAKVTGAASKTYAESRNLSTKMAAIESQRKLLASELNQASTEQLQDAAFMEAFERRNIKIDERRDSLLFTELQKNPNSYPLHEAFYGFLYYSGKSADPKKVRAMYNLMPAEIRNSETGKIWESFMPEETSLDTVNKEVTISEVAEAKPNSRFLEIGSIMPDFELKDPEGKVVKLSDYRGKYVLIDFWASWCRPCRAENPKLKALHKKHSSSNFDVLGVSLDEDKNKWQMAIMQDKLLDWKHASDLKGQDGGLGKWFSIFAIPDNFLINPQGRIVMRRGSMEAIDQRLGELLK